VITIENRQFPSPRVFNGPAEGVSLWIGHRTRGQKSTNDEVTRRSKKF